MKLHRALFAYILCLLLVGVADAASAEKTRFIVLTDISNEPDDEQSLVRYLVYSNEFDTEGLIATTSNYLRSKPREDLIRRAVGAYERVRPNLSLHAGGFPSAESLLAVTETGQEKFGMADVGEGRSTAGSRRIIEAVDRQDERPLWVGVWGGANTLAQALFDVRETRSEAELTNFVSKLRVYSISDQDDAGPWLRSEFPELFYIVSPTQPGWYEYHGAAWTGISGDRFFKIGVKHKFDMVDNPWLEQNVMKGHGPLGALYPESAVIMEGDTPSFLGLIDRGLGWDVSPSYGGWGGRYSLFKVSGESRPIWTDNYWSRDTVTSDNGRVETSTHATIWRWREHFQNDFAARMDWCVAETREEANHNPLAVLNGDRTTDVLTIEAKPGSTVRLSAKGTDAGDEGQNVNVSWWIYPEVENMGWVNSWIYLPPSGSAVNDAIITDRLVNKAILSRSSGQEISVTVPAEAEKGDMHMIMQVEDDGVPHLFSYRRAIIRVTP